MHCNMNFMWFFSINSTGSTFKNPFNRHFRVKFTLRCSMDIQEIYEFIAIVCNYFYAVYFARLVARTTSSVGSCRDAAGWLSVNASRDATRARPAAWIGWRTVLNGGWK